MVTNREVIQKLILVLEKSGMEVFLKYGRKEEGEQLIIRNPYSEKITILFFYIAEDEKKLEVIKEQIKKDLLNYGDLNLLFIIIKKGEKMNAILLAGSKSRIYKKIKYLVEEENKEYTSIEFNVIDTLIKEIEKNLEEFL